MPHLCTRCNRVFEDGMDVLEGCPVCGWNKFLFVKSKEKIKEVRGSLKARETVGSCVPWPEGDRTLRDIMNRTPPSNRRPESPQEERKDGSRRREKKKTGKHGFFELDPLEDRPPRPSGRRSDKPGEMEDKALESIRISEPGTYELNLPSLFERDELVMAVKEGTYLIDLSSAFKKSKKD